MNWKFPSVPWERTRGRPSALVWPLHSAGHSSFCPVVEGGLHFLTRMDAHTPAFTPSSNRSMERRVKRACPLLCGSRVSFLIASHGSEPSHMDIPTCKRQWKTESLFCPVTWTLNSVPTQCGRKPQSHTSYISQFFGCWQQKPIWLT